MRREAEANADSDKKAKEEIEKLNQADSMVFQTEKQLKEYGDKIPAEKKAPIESALTELKEAHASKDIARIDAAMAAMNTAWSAASEEMYKATNEQKGNDENANNTANNTNADKKNDSEVTDVDFEEVK